MRPRAIDDGSGRSVSEAAFKQLRTLFAERTGIAYPIEKRPLLASRLHRHLERRAVADFDAYVTLLRRPEEEAERQRVVDALTTHETSFFREPPHFQFLENWLKKPFAGKFRAWSAACSTGEEVYSVAMTLASRVADFEVVGTDVSQQSVERSRRGLYPIERAPQVPQKLLKAFCLKGVGAQQGTFRIGPRLRAHTRFEVANLMARQSALGRFHLALLRNVLIYFGPRERQLVVDNVVSQLEPGGYLMVGHAETSANLHPRLVSVQPSVFRLESAS